MCSSCFTVAQSSRGMCALLAVVNSSPNGIHRGAWWPAFTWPCGKAQWPSRVHSCRDNLLLPHHPLIIVLRLAARRCRTPPTSLSTAPAASRPITLMACPPTPSGISPGKPGGWRTGRWTDAAAGRNRGRQRRWLLQLRLVGWVGWEGPAQWRSHPSNVQPAVVDWWVPPSEKNLLSLPYSPPHWAGEGNP